MVPFTEEQIQEIAEQSEMGMRCSWHKITGELVFTPDSEFEDYTDMSFFKEMLDKLENDFENYIEIEKPRTRDQFNIMENFATKLQGNNSLKAELLNALQRPKPFRSFKNIVDDSGPYREKWFEFRDAQILQWFRNKCAQVM